MLVTLEVPEEFARFLKEEVTKWGKVVKAAGLQAQ